MLHSKNNLKKKVPYLSIIIPSRNDNHGGNMFKRMAVCLNGLFEQLEKHTIESELLFIEWNPPLDKPLLKDIIEWPKELHYCTIRAIQVPLAIHKKFKGSDKMPIYVGGAMNCGIRRARGTFILPSVIDLLYSDELMSFIASKRLKENERYRVDRCDVNKKVLQYNTLKEQLDYSKKNIIHVYGYEPHERREGLPNLHTDACGDFQLMSKHYWHVLHAYREGDIVSSYVDSLLSYASFSAGVKEVVLNNPLRIYHIDHEGKFSDTLKMQRPGFHKILSVLFRSVRRFIPGVIRSKMIFLYHKLIASRSYSEAGGIPVLDYVAYLNVARDVISGRRSYIFNDENWGLRKKTLPESTVRTADWDKEPVSK